MCGICGAFKFNNETIKPEDLTRMCNKMIHRGPDDNGYFYDKNFAMGMRRLSVIDLKTGKQPIFNEDKRFCVILNGEIYNYIELRRKLLENGHLFTTNSDTEVIIHLFEEKGAGCIDYLNGMFAFAVWDNLKKELYIFRDRLGIKPLFYNYQDSRFVFSSDLQSLRILSGNREIDSDSFLSYLGLSYVPYPKTIFKNVYKLAPGHFLRINSNGDMELKKYWEIKEFGTLKLKTIDEYKELLCKELERSVTMQMRSDVPLGVFLSGGLDSSSVVSILSKLHANSLKTFSIGFENGLNELPYAKLISRSFQTKHTEVFLRMRDVPDTINELIGFLDEPIYDNAMVPTFILAREAYKSKVKVILNGAGGDEIFGGYNRYLPGYGLKGLKKNISELPPFLRKMIGIILLNIDRNKATQVIYPRLIFLASGISGVNFGFLRNSLSDNKVYKKIINILLNHFNKFVIDGKKVNNLMYFDLRSYLVDDVLSLLDKMTMANSIEVRVPLLDHTLVELAFRIPDGIKLGENRLKSLLRYAMKDILPNDLFNLPKMGFSGPTNSWVKNSMKELIYRHLITEPIDFLKETINLKWLEKSLGSEEIKNDYCSSIFALFIFTIWYKKHIMDLDV